MSTTPRRARPAPGAGLVVRRRDGAVLLGTRTTSARSWPGTLAFPGGAVDPDDVDVPLLCGAADAVERAARAAALREALEEAGLVLVCRADGAPAPADVVDDVVAAVRAGGALGGALRARGLCLDDRGLVVLSAWRTAEGSFEVLRFLLCVEHDVPRTAPLMHELVDVAYRSPRAVLASWQAGHAWLLPPIRDLLHRLADVEDALDVEDVVVDAPGAAGRSGAAAGPLLVPGDGALARLRGGVSEAERCRRDLSPGVVVIDARTPTLWPATHTNAVVLGSGDVLLVDPATPYDDERARFDALLHTILDGARVQGIVLTHHHADHTGDAARLRDKHRCPVFAHALTSGRVDVDVDVVVDDGHVFALAAGPRGPARRFVALHTPGHARGHLCLWEEHLALLVAGDMVAGTGSILIDPPEGHMGTYLRSLERLAALGPRALVPSHGPLLVHGEARLRQQHAHRVARQAAVLRAIAAGAGDVDAVVDAVYGPDTPPPMLPFAARSVAAIVELLAEERAIVVDGDRFAAASGARDDA